MSDKGDCRTAPATPGLLNTRWRVSRAMSSVFSCLHRANEALCGRCGASLGPLEGKSGFVPAPIIGSVQGQDRREPNLCAAIYDGFLLLDLKSYLQSLCYY